MRICLILRGILSLCLAAAFLGLSKVIPVRCKGVIFNKCGVDFNLKDTVGRCLPGGPQPAPKPASPALFFKKKKAIRYENLCIR